MASISSISLSGMQVAQQRLQVSAHNVANVQTEGFRRQEVEQQALPDGGGVQARTERAAEAGPSLVTDMVGALAAKNSFLANLAVFRTVEQTLGRLLDDRA
ncbi:flagellar basal body protein [Pseudorhodoferax sp. Leaf267]|uniref:flagellar basal body protein n=1 Tax=Pseudorhodoferax sp. Leaf267 TaxID=1736316 RepID=UPI000701CA7B|nr:flagellar basal body protein [Pseudorhodoferax sp. Leaf267]KQP22476.1 flagellar basal body rod protein [Pseudorhodoferax sp. Leaf267]